jgi:glutathione S-transferase
MLLYHAPSSYYSMIARLALHEAGLPFDSRQMDIHRRKDQLAPWYVAINPHMTVPTLVDGERVLRDSRDILAFAAQRAGERWQPHGDAVEDVVAAHYELPIERFTFGKAMARIPPLRLLFPRMLRRIVRDLETELSTAADPDVVRAKIAVNTERLEYFETGSLRDKLDAQRERARRFLALLPTPADLLFGAKPTAADVVVAVFAGRLQMIDEWGLVTDRPDVAAWFERYRLRPAFAASDVWTRFQIRRILLGR